jgi:hypothetical protein
MQNLDKRISALEQASPQCEKVIFIIIGSLGEQDKELAYIHDNHGNHWYRLPDETEREFSDRATSETPRNENQVAMLFGEISHIEGHTA